MENKVINVKKCLHNKFRIRKIKNILKLNSGKGRFI